MRNDVVSAAAFFFTMTTILHRAPGAQRRQRPHGPGGRLRVCGSAPADLPGPSAPRRRARRTPQDGSGAMGAATETPFVGEPLLPFAGAG